MAGTDSVVQINEGTGKYLSHVQRSQASNTTYTPQVIVSEPYLPTYGVAVTTAASTATANSHLIQIMAGPLNRVVIRRILVTQLAAAGAATAMVCQLLRLTTAGTGGTSFTPRALDPVSDVTPATTMTLPSAKGTEGSILWTGVSNMLATVAVAGGNPILDLDFRDPRAQPIVISAGTSNGLALKNITAVASGTVHIYVEFSETFWS